MKRKRTYLTKIERDAKKRKIIDKEIKKNKPLHNEYDKYYREYYNLKNEYKKIPQKIKTLNKTRSEIKKKLKKLKLKLGTSKKYLKGAISKIPDDCLKEIALFMQIPDMFNYFSSCRRLTYLISKNKYIWKMIANRYVIKNEKDKIEITHKNGMPLKKKYRYMTYSFKNGYFEKKWIDDLYKEKKSWKEVTKAININYTSIYKKITSSFFIFVKKYRKIHIYNLKKFGEVWKNKSRDEKQKYEDIQRAFKSLQETKFKNRGIVKERLKIKLLKIK